MADLAKRCVNDTWRGSGHARAGGADLAANTERPLKERERLAVAPAKLARDALRRKPPNYTQQDRRREVICHGPDKGFRVSRGAAERRRRGVGGDVRET